MGCSHLELTANMQKGAKSQLHPILALWYLYWDCERGWGILFWANQERLSVHNTPVQPKMLDHARGMILSCDSTWISGKIRKRLFAHKIRNVYHRSTNPRSPQSCNINPSTMICKKYWFTLFFSLLDCCWIAQTVIPTEPTQHCQRSSTSLGMLHLILGNKIRARAMTIVVGVIIQVHVPGAAEVGARWSRKAESDNTWKLREKTWESRYMGNDWKRKDLFGEIWKHGLANAWQSRTRQIWLNWHDAGRQFDSVRSTDRKMRSEEGAPIGRSVVGGTYSTRSWMSSREIPRFRWSHSENQYISWGLQLVQPLNFCIYIR